MQNLIILGLAAAVVIAAVAGAARTPPPPQPQLIILQPALPAEQGGTGCLPLLILVGVVLAAFVFT